MRKFALTSVMVSTVLTLLPITFAQAQVTSEMISATLHGSTSIPTTGTATDAQISSAYTQLQDTVRRRDAALAAAQAAATPEVANQIMNTQYHPLAAAAVTQANNLQSAVATQAAAALENTPSPCASEEKKAVSTCSLGLDPVQEALLRQTMNQATAMMQQGGTEKTCKAAKMVQTVAAGANMAHAAMCSGAVKACKVSCTPYAKGVPQNSPEAQLARRSLAKCVEMESRAVASIAAGVQNMLGIAMSGKCQSAVTTNQPAPGSSPPAAMDCTNPMLSSTPACVCATNPSDAICTGSSPGLGDGSYASDGGAGLGGPGIQDPELIGFDDEIGLLEPSGGGGLASQGGGGGGGGGMGGGSGAGALPPEEMGGGGQGPYNTDVMGGLTGGGGSGGGSFGRGGGTEGSGGGSLFDSLADKLNLKGFLPNKADFKNRGLASGTGADGITGPNGPSLFEKVSSRYLKKQSELLP